MNLRWNEKFAAIYEQLNRRLSVAKRNAAMLVARAYLRQLQQGGELTPQAIVRSIYDNDAPKAGWRDRFDGDRLAAYVPHVEKALGSYEPWDVMCLYKLNLAAHSAARQGRRSRLANPKPTRENT